MQPPIRSKVSPAAGYWWAAIVFATIGWATTTLLAAQELAYSELVAMPLVAVADAPATAPATEPATDSAEIEIQELRNRLDELEQSIVGTKAAIPKQPDDVPLDKWNVKLGGHVQLDYINWADADPAIVGAENYFGHRRLRLVADGVGYGQFDFRLQMTLEPGQGPLTDSSASPDVKDAYITMNDIPGLGRIRLGNFFVPFSLEQVTNDTNNIFLERSIPSQNIFAADREVGIALYNCNCDQTVTWACGCFFDDISDTFKVRTDDNQGTRLSARLTALPYYDRASEGRYLIHTGAGVLYTDDQDNEVSFRARPQVQRGPVLISSGVLPADSFTTGNLELAVVCGSLTLQAEAFDSAVNLTNGGTVHANGAYVHLSYFLTGEHRIFEPFGQHGPQFDRNRPHKNLAWTCDRHGPGAWELKTRWSTLDVSDSGGGRYNDMTTGVNWYWSDRTRIMFDWIHPTTSAATVFGATDSDLLGMRLDFNW